MKSNSNWRLSEWDCESCRTDRKFTFWIFGKDAMKSTFLALLCCAVLLLVFLPTGCSQDPQDIKPTDFSGHIPLVRILIEQGQSTVKLTASQPPVIFMGSSPSGHRLDVMRGVPISISLTNTGWRCGNLFIGNGEMMIQPTAEGSVAIDDVRYRGRFRLVPTGTGKFDVVNDVDLEGYLKGVIPRELPPLWEEETYKAQAVVARTYALFELKAASPNSHYDLFGDQRSQVYGGINAESVKSRAAVNATTGIVVTSGPPGHERIFKAYFSSCCGGIGQSAADAFGDPPTAPLVEQSVGTLCSASPHFTWPAVLVTKEELTKRFRHFGQLRNRPEKDMAAVIKIEVAANNQFGRPVRFVVTDARGNHYNWTGEEIRWAVDTDATETTKLRSSLFQIENQPLSIRFVNGHGQGHGVGMCQWCAERRAEEGMIYQNIVTASYPGSKLLQAY
jgi:stage II sporulation protein D